MRNRGFFFTLLISNCMILLFSLMIASVDYLGYKRSTLQYTQEYNHVLLGQISDIIDERLQSAHQLVQSISANHAIDRLRTIDDLEDKYGRVNSVFAMQSLESYTRVYHYVDSIFLYFQKSDVVITNTSVYRDTDTFLKYFSDEPYWSKEQWTSLFRNHRYAYYSNLESLSGGKHRLFTIVYPQGQIGSDERIYIVLNLDYGFLEQFGKEAGFFPESLLVALAPDREIMFTLGDTSYLNSDWYASLDFSSRTFTHEGRTLSLAQIKSGRYDWEYFIITPQDLFVSRATNLYVLGAIVLILIAGIAFSIASAKLNFMPVRNIVRKLRIQSEVDASGLRVVNELDFIDRMMTKSLEEYHDLKQVFTSQIPVIRMHQISSFLYGGFHGDETVARARFAEVGMSLNGPVHRVVIFHLDTDALPEDARSLWVARFQSILMRQEALGGELYTADIDLEGYIPALYSSSHETSANLEIFIQKTASALLEANILLTTAIGRPVGDLLSLPASYAISRRALQARLMRVQGGIVFGGASPDANNFYYPQELETRLIHSVKSGKLQEAYSILDTIILTNFSGEGISLETSRCLMFSMMSTALRIISSFDLSAMGEEGLDREQVFAELQECRNLQDMEALLRQLYQKLCLCAAKRRQGKSGDGAARIIRYIHENLSSQNLSLVTAAEAVDMNPTYLSSYFKEQTSHNFQSYVNDLRLEKSLEYLCATQTSIAEISLLVGYTGSGVFIRNFKKKYGQTPGQYREKAVAQQKS